MKVALIVNPLAGIGGPVALKGSDGAEIVEQAFARGASQQAGSRALQAFQALQEHAKLENASLVTASGDMGENVLEQLQLCPELVYSADPVAAVTTAADTREAVKACVSCGIDLLVFAGGDGTARDVMDALCEAGAGSLPVIGIPAGVKIHSAVYAVTPADAGEMLGNILAGQAVSLRDAEVMDLDEQAFRDGRVVAKCYGYLKVPVDDVRMQVTKEGGINHGQLALDDIAGEVIDTMQPGVLYLVGSGSTTASIMEHLGLDNTLLGIDAVRDQSLVASDLDEAGILELLGATTSSDPASGQLSVPAKIIVTLIGGQGHVFGRGNQQFSARVIRAVGRDNIMIVATNEKIRSIDNRPMIADTGDPDLDKQLSGLYPVITGYQQQTLYGLNTVNNKPEVNKEHAG